MVVGILALSMISNGDCAKETTNPKLTIQLELSG